MRTTNYIEQLNREIKRRANTIGVFLDADSLMRLVETYPIKENDSWISGGKIYY